ncbi:hypothetical protein [Desulfatirhabdium butyrativorans]|uniref:hypothetical protein n=1 Tax=Desulfatirhabdium butyrativorans TaxID=340467 RepID=UPI000410C495|nr:hypothetical protein [Desulfatirhabdium butyrativorans]
MISIDRYILEFVGNNWITLYLLFTILKGVAIMTDSVKDDRIVTLLGQVWSVLRSGRVPDRLEGCDGKEDSHANA